MNNADWTEETVRELERAIGYTFRDKSLLRTAFTHSTYKNLHGGEDNDRLEFLGDAVLQLCVSEKIYAHGGDAGEMTERRKQCVSQEALTEAEKKAGLMRFLRYEGRRDNLRGKTNSNLFEAVTAAIYLDGGRAEAEKFIFAYVQPLKIRNYIAELQEFVQSRVKKTPVYNIEKEENGIFYCRVSALKKSACGSGPSKQAAKAEAAKTLLAILEREEKA